MSWLEDEGKLVHKCLGRTNVSTNATSDEIRIQLPNLFDVN